MAGKGCIGEHGRPLGNPLPQVGLSLRRFRVSKADISTLQVRVRREGQPRGRLGIERRFQAAQQSASVGPRSAPHTLKLLHGVAVSRSEWYHNPWASVQVASSLRGTKAETPRAVEDAWTRLRTP